MVKKDQGVTDEFVHRHHPIKLGPSTTNYPSLSSAAPVHRAKSHVSTNKLPIAFIVSSWRMTKRPIPNALCLGNLASPRLSTAPRSPPRAVFSSSTKNDDGNPDCPVEATNDELVWLHVVECATTRQDSRRVDSAFFPGLELSACSTFVQGISPTAERGRPKYVLPSEVQEQDLESAKATTPAVAPSMVQEPHHPPRRGAAPVMGTPATPTR